LSFPLENVDFNVIVLERAFPSKKLIIYSKYALTISDHANDD